MPEDKPQEEEDGFVIRPPEPVRAGRQKQGRVGQPDSLNARNKLKAQVLSDSLFDRRANLRKAAGEPFESTDLSSTDRLQQYKDMISSKEMLIQALAGAAIVGRDGRLRISTAMVDAFVELSDA